MIYQNRLEKRTHPPPLLADYPEFVLPALFDPVPGRPDVPSAPPRQRWSRQGRTLYCAASA